MAIRSIRLEQFDLPALSKAPDDYFAMEHERRVWVALLNAMRAKTVIEIGVQEGHAAKLALEYVPTSVPLNSFVPDLKTMAMAPPAAWPYSADMPEVETATSWTALALGNRIASVSPKLLVPGVFAFMPSRV